MAKSKKKQKTGVRGALRRSKKAVTRHPVISAATALGAAAVVWLGRSRADAAADDSERDERVSS